MSSLIRAVRQEVRFCEQLLVHTGLREAYFFAKNSWGMLVHPQLTTARVWGHHYYTQMFLVFGFPFNAWLLLALITGLIVWLGQPGLVWRHRLLVFFLGLTGLLVLLAIYYASWIWRYQRVRQKNKLF